MNIPMFDSFLKTLTGPCRISEGETLLACVSGGIDSMVLLDLLLKAAGILRLRLGVVHVDHGIRKDASWRDALFVSEHCGRLGLPCHVYQLGMSPDSPNLEEEARTGRYEKIFSCMAEHGYRAAATGHTMDDQAETLIYRFIRGSGIRGLSGMEYRGANNLVRPLLSFGRGQIESYAASGGIPHVEDCTNLDTALARNLIRREIIPVMKKINPSIIKAVSRLADIAREEGDYIESRSLDLEGLSRVYDWGMFKAFRLEDIRCAPHAVLKRMAIRILSAMLAEPRGIDRIQVEGVMEVVAGEKAAHTIKRRVTVKVDDGCLVFCSAGKGPYYDIPVSGPGSYRIGDSGPLVKIDMEGAEGLRLRLRSWTQGERFQGRRVVKLLADKGIMKTLRPFWPVIVSGSEIVSIAGLWDSTGEAIFRTEFP